MTHASRPLRIVFLVGTLNLGGIERLITDLAVALKNTGHWDPSVCCLISKTGPFVQNLEECDIPVYQCPIQPHMMSFPIRLARLLKSISPDLVHSQVAYSLPWQVLGTRKAGVKKIIFTQHSDYPYWKSHFWARWRLRAYFRLCWPYISAYTTVSQAVRDSLSSLVGIPVKSFRVIYNPVNLDKFNFDAAARLAVRRELGVGEDEFLVGSIGRLDVPKGHRYLLEAAKAVIQALPNASFLIIGDGPLSETLKEQTRQLGIASRICFPGQRTDVQRIYPALDCFVSASIREGFHIALAEAMASCVPVVATKVGGTSEVLGASYPYLVPAEDPLALAQALLSLASNPDKARLLAKKSHQRVVQMFNLDMIVHQYVTLYEEVLGYQHQ
jgi:glycosyltransferase involved in cell wall biosynthesis